MGAETGPNNAPYIFLVSHKTAILTSWRQTAAADASGLILEPGNSSELRRISTGRKREIQTACHQTVNEGRESRKVDYGVGQVRSFVLSCLALLVGCIIDNDRVRVENLVAESPESFVFAAQTNTVMTPNDDGEAEEIRRDWLAQELIAHGMCPAGYVVETRELVELPEPPGTNAHDIVYKGRCLQAANRQP
jgi:hypothetical protein